MNARASNAPPCALVVGSTGNVGAHLVTALLAAGVHVRAATRDPSRARFPSGVEPTALDLDRPDGFASACSGVDRAFVMARTGDERADESCIPLIEALRRAGARHVVLLTGMGIERMPDAPLRKVELYVEASGLDWSFVRPNWFLQNFLAPGVRDELVARGVVTAPMGDARVAFVDARDVAAVAAEAIVGAGTGAHRNVAYALTGDDAQSHFEIAAAIAAATGRSIRYAPRTDEEERARLLAAGASEARVARRLAFLALARSGACATISGDVARVLGRPPRSLAQFTRDHADAWRVPSQEASS
jgi:uncharacterized protein YbjT (DUF2867 family)